MVMKMSSKETNEYLPRKTFYWAITIMVSSIMAVMGYFVARLDGVSDKFNHNFTTVKIDIAEIKTDLRLLREDLRP